MESTIATYRPRITFTSRQTHAFSLSSKTDANHSVHSFNIVGDLKIYGFVGEISSSTW